LGKKKLPQPVVIVDAPKDDGKIREWLHPENPYLWNSRPDPEDVEWWNEHFEPPEEAE
jgi:hypothetical protein